MARKIARVVVVSEVGPIAKADRIEVATVGGWKVVVRKGEFARGDLGIYFEIDAFLPEGVGAWQYLIDDRAHEFDGRRGHVLKSKTMKKQTSQGYLMPLAGLVGTALESRIGSLRPGDDVAEALGVVKYAPALPEELLATARGYPPGLIRGTDQERIQNLTEELDVWRSAAACWEATEKLEGWAAAYALIDGEFHACSSGLDFLPNPDHFFWQVAAELDLEAKLRSLGGGDFVLQGELIGPKLEGNNYLLKAPQFHLYRAYDVARGHKFRPAERRLFAKDHAIPCVPVVEEAFTIDSSTTVEALLAMADGASAINPSRRREGLVFERLDEEESFKAISDKYLLNVKL